MRVQSFHCGRKTIDVIISSWSARRDKVNLLSECELDCRLDDVSNAHPLPFASSSLKSLRMVVQLGESVAFQSGRKEELQGVVHHVVELEREERLEAVDGLRAVIDDHEIGVLGSRRCDVMRVVFALDLDDHAEEFRHLLVERQVNPLGNHLGVELLFDMLLVVVLRLELVDVDLHGLMMKTRVLAEHSPNEPCVKIALVGRLVVLVGGKQVLHLENSRTFDLN